MATQLVPAPARRAADDAPPAPPARGDGRVGQLVVYWDYDTQWGGDRSRAGRGPQPWGALEFAATDRLLALHAQYDVPACFAVVAAAALPGARPYHDPSQIRRIHAAGHEVASHALHHEWLPGLDAAALRTTLARSRELLEQCIGAPVVSFVPPYNQPFDHAARLSFSRSERREAGPTRTDLARLCRTLRETGYRTCRVAYRAAPQRLAEALLRRRLDRPRGAQVRIEGLACLRLNTPCGFGAETLRFVRRCAATGGTAVVYGHPHSLHAGGAQDERWLVPFLEAVAALRREGRLVVRRPSELAADHRPGAA